MPAIASRIKLFLDGADIEAMKAARKDPMIKGFTTNPTLMRKAGIADYAGFAKQVLAEITDLPVSFEVFSDDLAGMEREARIIHSWSANTNVKIPITNTKCESCLPLIRKLSHEGIVVNVTAILSEAQISAVHEAVAANTPSIISIFAGRIADTGVDPIPIMRRAVELFRDKPKAEILWASPREVLNLYQAADCGCHIITATPDILKKRELEGKNLEDYSLETVKMFDADATAAGYSLH
jgi:transaldolase